jgi:hypothetical protein
MKLCPSLCLTAVLCGATMFAPTAEADQTASTTISQIYVVERSHSKYKLFHGAVWLQVDKATHNYRWGGKHCNNSGLSDRTLGLMYDAFREKHAVTLDYQVVQYKKQTSRCITGITVSH